MSPPPRQPILDPSLSPAERLAIIKEMRQKLIRAQQIYMSLSNMVQTRTTPIVDLKHDIAQSRAVRKELQTELGDKLFHGMDLSIKRERSNEPSGDSGGEVKVASAAKQKRKPKRSYN